ncbi:uncharacterized protein LOC142317976 [Lycorma delicatula]|uniref:uncharacterized protein LOC142317976 n=1 Tax=Lycorma delicatula TaxID=130591 RepID=UPI003F5127AF
MQKLWSYSLGWDERVPAELLKEWTQFKESLHMLSNIQVKRAIVPKKKGVLKLKIHRFAVASESACGACIYLKCIDLEKNITINLVTSKSLVAPLKKFSLPRLRVVWRFVVI